jgi:dephospho-CoA kinase
MLKVGLTGGIGCGKTAVATALREKGIPVLDADLLARQIISSGGPAHNDVVREFGSDILDLAGNIDRQKLAKIVFRERASLEKLNALVHPHVRRAIEAQFAEWARHGGPAIGVVEAALLVEAGYQAWLDRLVVVWCGPDQQRERLLARGLTSGQITQRMASQMPNETKRQFATDEIDNSGTIEQLQARVDALARRLREIAA